MYKTEPVYGFVNDVIKPQNQPAVTTAVQLCQANANRIGVIVSMTGAVSGLLWIDNTVGGSKGILFNAQLPTIDFRRNEHGSFVTGELWVASTGAATSFSAIEIVLDPKRSDINAVSA